MTPEPLMTLPEGELHGQSLPDGGLLFAGIPFAAPPVGSLRFQPPQPAAPWEGVREATAFPPAPAQRPVTMPGLPTVESSEDCLYLNVWTPALNGKRPVMVWVFGGGFEGGSGSPPMTNGAALMRRDIVFVSFNYRVGALGFLHLADLGAPAFAGSTNLGLLDQVAALRWVRAHIAAFGGDPANVTVFGESAGGFSIGALLAMPAAAGLFDKAIMQSGATSRTFSRETATAIARDFLDQVGVSSPQELLNVPVERILDHQQAVIDTDIGKRNTPGGRSYGAVLDGTVLPRSPLEVVASGGARHIPLIVGACRDEAQAWEVFLQGADYAPSDEATLLAEMGRCVGAGLAEPLLRAYQRRAPEAPLARLRTYFLSDWIYRIPAIECARAQRASGGAVWSYLFAHVVMPQIGAHHGAELPYTFDALDQPSPLPITRTEVDFQIRDTVVGAWTAFARSGDPGWPKYQAGSPSVRQIGGDGSLIAEPPADVDAIWRAYWERPTV